MRYAFGDLVTQHLSRKHGLSQNKLAEGVDQDPAVISAMCNGRRLSGRQARERVLAIIRWLCEQGALDARAEANALLEAARMARLDPGEPDEADLLALLTRTRVSPGSSADGAAPDRPGAVKGGRSISRKALLLIAVALIAAGTIGVAGAFLLRGKRSWSPAWQETFDPLHADLWQDEYASAAWEDIPGPGAVLRENDPVLDYGKAESVPIAVDVSDYPILRVSVTAVDPGASYTVQILDKINDTSRDVLEELVYPGEHAVDLSQAMDWQGLQVFTINLWVGGESKSITVDRISIEAARPPAR
jgi:hypothetical protein